MDIGQGDFLKEARPRSDLALRQPGWLSIGAGAASGAMVSGAGLGGLALLSGLVVSPVLLGGAAGLFFLAQVGGLALSHGPRFSTGSLVAAVLSLGHALFLITLGFAAWRPTRVREALEPVVGKSIFTIFGTDGSFLLTFGPIFLIAMIGYTVLAPVSLIIFRYITFRK